MSGPDSEWHSTHMSATAAGGSWIYQAGQDQYVVGRDLHLHYSDGVHRARRVRSDTVPEECPYPGLVAFGPEQGRWFFGRDRMLTELTGRVDRSLREGGPLVVVAPSGAGKSSLLRAGLLPALARGDLEGSQRRPCLLFTPTSRPMEVLAKYLATVVGIEPDRVGEVLREGPEPIGALLRGLRLGRSDVEPGPLVLIVDQLEEVFTLCRGESERHDFLDLLTHLTEQGPSGEPPVASVVFGVRADFYARCADHPGLRAASQRNQLFVGPMSETELRQAILRPAEAAGLDVEPGLVELLLADLGPTAPGRYEAGRLPLLAHALRATWQQRHGHTLTVDGYRTTGGIDQAVATTVEDIFTSLDETGRQIAKALVLRLVNIGDATTGDTRRRVTRESLTGIGNPDVVVAVLDAFTGSRLLTHDRDTVEITHEALLRAWPRLRDWIDHDRTGHLVRQEVEQAAASWHREGRDPSRLYRGSRLETAHAMTTGDLTANASAFLAESVRHHHRTVRGRWLGVAALVVLALVASVTAVVAVRQGTAAHAARDTAVANQRTAVLNQITAEADRLRGDDASLAAQLDLTAYRMHPSPELHTKLVAVGNTPLSTTSATSGGSVRSVAFSPDGRVLASGDDIGAIRLWDITQPAEDSSLAVLARHTGFVSSVAFSPDGRTLVLQ